MAKKQTKPTLPKLIKKLDAVFSRFIRLRDSNKKWMVKCPLCTWIGSWKDAQNMHFIKRFHKLFRFDEINCHAWCKRCNVVLDGNYMEYTLWMIDTYGLEKVKEMQQRQNETKHWKTYEIEEMINYYSEQVKELAKEKGISLK